MNGPESAFFHLLHVVDRFSEDIEDPSEEFFPHRDHKRLSRVGHRRSPGQSLGRSQADAANGLGVELDHDLDTDGAVVTGKEHIPDTRQ